MRQAGVRFTFKSGPGVPQELSAYYLAIIAWKGSVAELAPREASDEHSSNMTGHPEATNHPASLLHGTDGSGFEAYRARLHAPGLDVPAALGQLTADASWLICVAERSSRHGLGFERIELWRDAASDCVLRLHVWWGYATAAAPDTHDIHNHGRPLAVRLLCGGYRSEVWTAHSPHGPFKHYRYWSDDRTLATRVRLLGTAKLSLESATTLTAGDCYTIQPTTLHRVIPFNGRITASLILQGAPALEHSDIFTLRDLDATVPHPNYSAAELEDMLVRLQHGLSS